MLGEETLLHMKHSFQVLSPKHCILYSDTKNTHLIFFPFHLFQCFLISLCCSIDTEDTVIGRLVPQSLESLTMILSIRNSAKHKGPGGLIPSSTASMFMFTFKITLYRRGQREEWLEIRIKIKEDENRMTGKRRAKREGSWPRQHECPESEAPPSHQYTKHFNCLLLFGNSNSTLNLRILGPKDILQRCLFQILYKKSKGIFL